MTYSGTIWDKTFGARENAFVSAAWRYRQAGAETWTSGTTAIMPMVNADGTFSFSGAFAPASGGWASDKSYEVEITLTDCVTSATMMATLNVGIPGIYIKRVGMAYQVGVGKIPDIDDGMDIKGLLKVGGFADPSGARSSLIAPQKPKLLWSGSLGYGSGTISVPGIQFYRALIVTTNNSVPMLACSDDGKYFLCSGGLFHYYVEGQGLFQRGFTMALDSANEGAVKIEYSTWMDHNPSAVHSASQTSGIMLYRIYGLVRHDDVQEVTA